MSVLEQIQLLTENIAIADLPKVTNIIELRKHRETDTWLNNLPAEDEEISLEEELEVEAILERIRNGEETFLWEDVKLEIGVEDNVEVGV
jgi:hypothetical protein